MNVACVLLAAGAGKRFGGDKLLYPVDGVPMAVLALERFMTIPFCARVCVTRTEADFVRGEAARRGYDVALNPLPERGVGTSVAVGTAAAEALCRPEGILFAVCDQPYLGKASIERLLGAFAAAPGRIVSLAYGGRRGNPAVFPRELFPDLCALAADIGGGAVIRNHPDRLLLVEADNARELDDVDTREEGTI